MIVVIRRDIGNFPDVVGGVAHGHPQTRRFDHRAVIAGVATAIVCARVRPRCAASASRPLPFVTPGA